jgi:hypothetical protein
MLSVPHTCNADRRTKILKQKRRVINCAGYGESLLRRGDLSVWMSEEARTLWAVAPRTTRGGQAVYPDLAIELSLAFGMVLKQPRRQTLGLMRSIAGLLWVEVAVPHFTTLSRGGNGLSLPSNAVTKSAEPVHQVVASTGLKVFGEGEWLAQQHKTKCKRRSWRELLLGLGLVSGQIVCSGSTADDMGDPSALPGLLDQIDGPVEMCFAHGADGGEPTCAVLTEHFGASVKVTIPPPKNAILSPGAARNPGICSHHKLTR